MSYKHAFVIPYSSLLRLHSIKQTQTLPLPEKGGKSLPKLKGKSADMLSFYMRECCMSAGLAEKGEVLQ